jgi:EAL domain-containing protein (putative c-di-GMP-specific phosphodiesterase class I)
VLGYEALSRGPEEFAFQSAQQIFEIAAESNLIFELDRHRRRSALADARGIEPPVKVFINAIASSLNDPEFEPEKLSQRLEELDLTPEQIVIEMTQESLIDNVVIFETALEKYIRKGFSFSVDDVGTMQSRLEKITCLNPTYLKIETDLVQEIDKSFVGRETVKAIKTFADNIGATIIAGGVERQEEREALLELGIHYCQGFLLGRPEPRTTSADANG